MKIHKFLILWIITLIILTVLTMVFAAITGHLECNDKKAELEKNATVFCQSINYSEAFVYYPGNVACKKQAKDDNGVVIEKWSKEYSEKEMNNHLKNLSDDRYNSKKYVKIHNDCIYKLLNESGERYYLESMNRYCKNYEINITHIY